MSKPIVVVTLLAVSCFALASDASAQERKGFWFDLGIGIGSAGISSGGADESRGAAGTGEFRVGWAVNPRFLVGFELRAISVDIAGDIVGTMGAYNVEGVVLYYPRASSRLFVSGGIGGSVLDLEVEEQGTTLSATIAKGFGVSAGIGYDIYLGRGFSLTPAASFWYGHPGDATFRGERFLTDWSHNVVDATVSIKFN